MSSSTTEASSTIGEDYRVADCTQARSKASKRRSRRRSTTLMVQAIEPVTEVPAYLPMPSSVKTWKMDADGNDFTSENLAKRHAVVAEQFESFLARCLQPRQSESVSLMNHITCKDTIATVVDANITTCNNVPDSLNYQTDLSHEMALRQDAIALEMEGLLKLEIFGSSVTNLALPGKSDVDVNVTLDSDEPSLGYRQRALQFVQHRVAGEPRITIIETRPFARVPVIKVEFTTDEGLLDGDAPLATIQGDITFSHGLPRYNSTLLRVYGQWDPLVRRLMLTVKHWASVRSIKDASQGFLSSYSYMLLVVFYAQQRMNLPVLQNEDAPVLSHLGVTDVSLLKSTVEIGDGRKIDVIQFPDVISTATSRDNIDQVSSASHCILLLGFLEFLANMSEKHTISVRKGKLLPREEVAEDQSWKWSIEDPFEHFDSSAPRDLGCVLRDSSLAELKEEIARGVAILRRWYNESGYMMSTVDPKASYYSEMEADNALSNLFKPCDERVLQRRRACVSALYPEIGQTNHTRTTSWNHRRETSRSDHRYEWMHSKTGNMSSSSVVSDASSRTASTESVSSDGSFVSAKSLMSTSSDDTTSTHEPFPAVYEEFIPSSHFLYASSSAPKMEPMPGTTEKDMTSSAGQVLMEALGVVRVTH